MTFVTWLTSQMFWLRFVQCESAFALIDTLFDVMQPRKTRLRVRDKKLFSKRKETESSSPSLTSLSIRWCRCWFDENAWNFALIIMKVVPNGNGLHADFRRLDDSHTGVVFPNAMTAQSAQREIKSGNLKMHSIDWSESSCANDRGFPTPNTDSRQTHEH